MLSTELSTRVLDLFAEICSYIKDMQTLLKDQEKTITMLDTQNKQLVELLAYKPSPDPVEGMKTLLNDQEKYILELTNKIKSLEELQTHKPPTK